VTSGGNVAPSNPCGVAAGTRFVNNAGKAAVSVTATIAAPESGETVLFTATSSSTVTSAVAASGTSVSATMNLSTLSDGTVTLTAQTKDLAGNLSTTTAPANVVVKDVVAPALSVTYNNIAVFADNLSGTSECGATLTALETAGPHVGNHYPPTGTFTVGAGGTYSNLTVDATTLGAYGYDVTATDLAGNTHTVSISGNDLL
jgi:hypothetical protein